MPTKDPVELVQEKVLAAYAYLRREATEALYLARERGILQDRDVQIAAGAFVGGWLFLSFGVGFGLAVGYLAYHYIRCDNRTDSDAE